MRVLVLTIAFLGAADCRAAVRQTEGVSPAVSQVLTRMSSPTWTERSAALSDAFFLLISANQTDQDARSLRLGMIQLLALENSPKKVSREARTEDHAYYYAFLVARVADLDEERAIPALLAAAHLHRAAIEGVARFGKKALPAVLEQAKAPDAALASGAISVVQAMLESHTVNDRASWRQIKQALKTALTSPYWEVKDAAIYAIPLLDDPEEFVPMLKQVAERDPTVHHGVPLNDGSIGDDYFVREKAKKALADIAKNKKPPAGSRQRR